MMRHLLICGGLDGRAEPLPWLQRAVEERRPDGVLFVGGIVSLQRECAVTSTPWGLSRDDAILIGDFFKTLGHFGVFTAFIPGPVGVPLDEFLRLAMFAEDEFPTVHSVHATLVEQGDVAVTGLGGLLSEHPLSGVETVTRTMAEYHLRPLRAAIQPRKVLLLAAPPPGPLGGPKGSTLVGELIDSFHPELCVVAGDSAHRGVQRIAKTLIVNPGCLADGWVAWLDWSKARDEQVEFVNLKLEADDAESRTPASQAAGG
jgi:hypothetical protein